MPRTPRLIPAMRQRVIRFGNVLRQLAKPLAITITIGSCVPPSSNSFVLTTPMVAVSPLYGVTGPWQGPLQSAEDATQTIPVVRAFSLTSSNPQFGGFSGLSLSKDGVLTAISDRGHFLSAQMGPEPGMLPHQWDLKDLSDTNGSPLVGRKWSDAEDIALLPNRGFIVSYEQKHRLWYYPLRPDTLHPLTGTAQDIPIPEPLKKARRNAGIEAIAVLPGERLLIIEEGKSEQGQTNGWISTPLTPWEKEVPLIEWEPFTLTLSSGMSPTAVTVLHPDQPDATILLLERNFSLFTGFSARLRHIALSSFLSQVSASRPIDPEVLTWLQTPPINDNWEGMAIDPRHPSSLWIVTDDNYNSFQRTMMVELDCSLCAKKEK